MNLDVFFSLSKSKFEFTFNRYCGKFKFWISSLCNILTLVIVKQCLGCIWFVQWLWSICFFQWSEEHGYALLYTMLPWSPWKRTVHYCRFGMHMCAELNQPAVVNLLVLCKWEKNCVGKCSVGVSCSTCFLPMPVLSVWFCVSCIVPNAWFQNMDWIEWNQALKSEPGVLHRLFE